MSSLHETRRKSDDLSKYIKRQLSTLLKKVKQTPPKKSSSLKKIQNMIQNSDIKKSEKNKIVNEIRRVQSAIQRSSSVETLKLKLRNEKKSKSKYEKNLFYQNLILQQKQLNIKNKLIKDQKDQSGIKMKKQYRTNNIQEGEQFINLVQMFEQLRLRRLKYENQIQELSLKAQKLQRLIELKRQNEQRYLKSIDLKQKIENKISLKYLDRKQSEDKRKYMDKKQKLESIKQQVKSAARSNRVKMVSVLMRKYNQVQNT